MNDNVFTQNTIAERLRTSRIRAGLSQRELASPGCSYAYISRIESGARTPSVRALRKLAPKLGVSVEWLETGVQPLEVEGQLTDRLVRDLLERARASGIKGRARVRVRVEAVA